MAVQSSPHRVWPWLAAAAVVAGGVAVWMRRDTPPAPPHLQAATASDHLGPGSFIKANITYAEAKPILEAFHDTLPAALRATTPSALESAWPIWVRAHDADVRARLARGDEDSLVNFWMFGTSFTTRPRATALDLAPLGGRAGARDVLLGRLDDLSTALASPGSNERLQFARQLLDRRAIDPTTPAGREAARAYLIELHERVIADNDRYRRAAQTASQLNEEQARLAAFATAYSDRGLSSDTSLAIDFALDDSLHTAHVKGRLADGVRRVAIIGPGLDFTDKADGYDFYPQQTIQPFALIDSLVRLQLATNDPAHQWEPGLVQYWQVFGSAIGDVVPGLTPPPGAAHVNVRAVRVRPSVGLAITARDLDIVVERPALPDSERFDLIVATNVLVYYDAFEQALALQNLASMLRPGGFFLTNYAVSPSAPLESRPSLITTTYWDRQRNVDTLFWYQRR